MQPNNATVATAIAHNTLVTGPTFRRTTKRLPPFAAHPPRVSCTSIQALSGRFGWFDQHLSGSSTGREVGDRWVSRGYVDHLASSPVKVCRGPGSANSGGVN
jgi:hypothetical protein